MFLKRTVAFMGMWTVFCWLLFSIAKDQNVKGKVMIKETTYHIYHVTLSLLLLSGVNIRHNVDYNVTQSSDLWRSKPGVQRAFIRRGTKARKCHCKHGKSHQYIYKGSHRCIANNDFKVASTPGSTTESGDHHNLLEAEPYIDRRFAQFCFFPKYQI